MNEPGAPNKRAGKDAQLPMNRAKAAKKKTTTRTTTPSATARGGRRGAGGEIHQDAARNGVAMTTTLGTPIADNQNSLRIGARGPTLLEDFILREKITHFDHERIPERIVHARGSAAHGYFQAVPRRTPALTRGGVPAEPEDAGRRCSCASRPSPAAPGSVDTAARRARLRRQVLHRGGQLRSGRQQHPGVLHPGRDQVSRPRSTP